MPDSPVRWAGALRLTAGELATQLLFRAQAHNGARLLGACSRRSVMMRKVTIAFVATAVIAGAGVAPTVASAGGYGNRADIRADRQDLRADRQDIRRDRADLRQDFRDLGRDLRSHNRADF